VAGKSPSTRDAYFLKGKRRKEPKFLDEECPWGTETCSEKKGKGGKREFSNRNLQRESGKNVGLVKHEIAITPARAKKGTVMENTDSGKGKWGSF